MSRINRCGFKAISRVEDSLFFGKKAFFDINLNGIIQQNINTNARICIGYIYSSFEEFWFLVICLIYNLLNRVAMNWINWAYKILSRIRRCYNILSCVVNKYIWCRIFLKTIYFLMFWIRWADRIICIMIKISTCKILMLFTEIKRNAAFYISIRSGEYRVLKLNGSLKL